MGNRDDLGWKGRKGDVCRSPHILTLLGLGTVKALGVARSPQPTPLPIPVPRLA